MKNKKQKTKNEKAMSGKKTHEIKKKEGKKQRQERIEKKKQELDIGIFVQPHFRPSQ